MSKPRSYLYTGTKGHIIDVIDQLPRNGFSLLGNGWTDISHPEGAAHNTYTFKEISTGLKVKYDPATPSSPGFGGVNHYHVLNPDATSNNDLYLDKKGNPVPKNSTASHIIPNGG